MPGEVDWQGRRLHFVGIGGSGMSGLAHVCARLGARVSGSDRAAGPAIDALRDAGIEVAVGHAPEQVPEQSEVVYSSAVRPDNVERARARELGLPEIRRGELLADVARLRRCIAIAGTHGKTTTAWMTVCALRGAGFSPGHLIGAGLRDGSPSWAWEQDEWLVVETDESDRSFLALAPEVGVVTNIALEHEREYASLQELERAFDAFMQRARQVVGPGGPVPDGLTLDGGGSRFRWRGHDVALPVPGEHNARNAAAALDACLAAGADAAAAAAALASYPGARRRLEPLGPTPAGALVYDDYAHHANEIRASLAALRTLRPQRVVAVFEPLLYSRTRQMASDWAAALAHADAVVVLDVFPGSEAGDPAVSGRLLVEALTAIADGPDVSWRPTGDEASAYLAAELREGDACVVMGAGPVPQSLARSLVRSR